MENDGGREKREERQKVRWQKLLIYNHISSDTKQDTGVYNMNWKRIFPCACSCSVSNQQRPLHLSHPLPHSLNLREAGWHKTADSVSVSSHLLYIWLLGEYLVSAPQKLVVSLCAVRSMSWQTSKRRDENVNSARFTALHSNDRDAVHSTVHSSLFFGLVVVLSRFRPLIAISPPGVLQEVHIWKPKSTKMHCEVKNKLFSAAGSAGMWQNPCVAVGLRLIGTIWAELFVYCNNQTPLSPLSSPVETGFTPQSHDLESHTDQLEKEFTVLHQDCDSFS